MPLKKDCESASQAALLSDDGSRISLSSSREDPEIWKHEKSSRWRWYIHNPFTVHMGIFITYSLVFVGMLHSRSHCQRPQYGLAYVPYVGEFEAIVFEHKHSIYVGNPRPELDVAWEELLQNSNIRITEEEIAQIPGRKEQAIRLPDGGYFASTSVYHNLHCIKRLHHYMYRDHYFPNISHEQELSNVYHNHHCLDMLRQSVMCTGDTQLLTMKWASEGRIPTANFTTPHRCVNWPKLDSWAAGRRIDRLMEQGYLVHPTLGPAYPGGHGDIVGELGKLGDP